MNPIQAVAAFSLYVFGIILAPIITPHITERVGRKPTYLVSTLLSALFAIGTSRSTTYAAVAVTRFFAGLTGGPIAVLVEGTFADLWSETFTGSYYIFIMMSQYLGAATGAIAGGAIVERTGGWRWTEYLHVILAAAALLYGAAMPETFPRALVRRAARRDNHRPDGLEPAPTGTDIGTMVRLTVTQPLAMLVAEPIVVMLALSLSLNFGVLFTAFVAVPATLSAGGLGPRAIGLAFLGPFAGALTAALIALVLDQAAFRRSSHKIEHRMLPAMLGALLATAALFWIGWTTRAGVAFPEAVPIAGLSIYVCGSALMLIGFISFIFDAYPRQETLSALTALACTRVLSAGWFVMIVPIAVLNIPSQWLFGIWGILTAVLAPVPFVVLFFGERLRTRSRYAETKEVRSYHSGSSTAMSA